MKKIYLIIIVLLAVSTFVMTRDYSSQAAPIASSEKISVVTSFYPLFFLASEIAGDRANVSNITPAGAEPHDYEPTARDIQLIENSDVLVLNGVHLEAWGERMTGNINPEQTIVVSAAEGLATQDVVEDGEGILDPHVWLNPALAKEMADKIVVAIIAADSANADYYASNARKLSDKLLNLDREYSQGLSSCARKDIVTSHDAFGYMASAYGLNQVSVAGLSPDAEPSPKEIASVAKFAKDNGVKYIFFESLISPKLAETIATEIGAETMVLNPLEGLSEDEIEQGKDYVTEMRVNLANLEKALQCKK